MSIKHEFRRLMSAAVNSVAGWTHMVRYEPNMRYLTCLVILTAAVSFACGLSSVQFGVLIVSLCAAVGFEIFNTALENLLDLSIPHHCEQVRRTKDMTSGAVFLALLIYAVLLLVFIVPEVAQKLDQWR